MAISGISSSLTAIQRQSASMDRAADKVARATSSLPPEVPTDAAEADALVSQEAGLVDGTVEMMVARRMFSAALRMAQTANEGILEVLRIGGYEGAQAG